MMKKFVWITLIGWLVIPHTTAAAPYCREYTKQIRVGGYIEEGFGTACRQPDGAWETKSAHRVPHQSHTVQRADYVVATPHYPEPARYYHPRPQTNIGLGIVLGGLGYYYADRHYDRHYDRHHHYKKHRWHRSHNYWKKHRYGKRHKRGHSRHHH